MKTRITLAALAAATAALSAPAQAADEGNWMVRARVLSMQPENDNSTTTVVPALGTVEPEDKVFPELDFSYFFTKNIAAELILTVPQKHDVTLGGVNIGSVKHLPPTLTIQYHFLPEGTFRPYVGAGINYTRFSSVNLNAITRAGVDSPLKIDRSSWGLAAQVGADIKLADKWFLNVDLKYVQIDTRIEVESGALAGTHVTDLDIDPWLFSVGVGYRF